MKSVYVSSFLIIISILVSSNTFAQNWEPPFKIEPDSLLFDLPQTPMFSNYDSAYAFIKIQFHEDKNKIRWFDLIKLNLFKSDSVIYSFFIYDYQVTSDWSKNAKQKDIKTYPDSVTISLIHYLDKKIKRMEFEPTKYVKEYRLTPISVPIRLKNDKPAH